VVFFGYNKEKIMKKFEEGKTYLAGAEYLRVKVIKRTNNWVWAEVDGQPTRKHKINVFDRPDAEDEEYFWPLGKYTGAPMARAGRLLIEEEKNDSLTAKIPPSRLEFLINQGCELLGLDPAKFKSNPETLALLLTTAVHYGMKPDEPCEFDQLLYGYYLEGSMKPAELAEYLEERLGYCGGKKRFLEPYKKEDMLARRLEALDCERCFDKAACECPCDICTFRKCSDGPGVCHCDCHP
jgi:hypothetical protein